MFYSKTTCGFYSREIHGDKIPADAVEITDAEHAALINGQSQGKRIVADAAGRPMLQDPPAPTTAELAVQVRADRDRRLTESDWIVTKSAESGVATPAAWATYRQALRDVPAQAGFPSSVTWPQKP